jgi:hypothetical protein
VHCYNRVTALIKKYFSYSRESTSATAVVTEEQCPPGLWKTPQQSAALSGTLATTADSDVQIRPDEGALTLTRAEQMQMHVRVIALENLVIALLATATDHQLDCAREMAAYITPRPGATAHPLTINAAVEMVSMVERAIHFRGTPPK